MPEMSEVNNAVELYLRNHRKPESVKEAINQLPKEELEKRFLKRLEFGTAGLRGAMGEGFFRMNEVTVMQATQGLCAYVLETFGDEGKTRGVVIGFDGRHGSKEFANTAAAVFLVKGYKVYLNSKVTATPMNPFTILKKNCIAGVQVTASHNPKADNGYKVYGDNGAQINTPVDTYISEAITKNLERWAGVADLLGEDGMLKDASTITDPYDEILKTYLDELVEDLSCGHKTDVPFVYTAMHGVGAPFVHGILDRVGLAKSMHVVKEQNDPDPEFSTVSFPNPEEKGALDLAKATGDACGARFLIANDPDADRLAAAEKLPSGEWRLFTGDEIGVLLGHRCIELATRKGMAPEKMLAVSSLVSSSMLGKIVQSKGGRFEDTLTGFKWIMNKALEIQETDSVNCIFGYEEALGYGCSMKVPDKDGVSASLVWAEMAMECYHSKSSVTDRLLDLKKEYGFYVANNGYFICHDKKVISDIFTEMRSTYPKMVGDFKIARIRDATTGFDSGSPDKKASFPPVASSEMITFFLENGAECTLRTSGTEPKVKWYSELSAPKEEDARSVLDQVVKAVQSQLLQPEKFGLLSS